MSNLKICYKCKESKHISLFSKNTRCKDKLENKCKLCIKKDRYIGLIICGIYKITSPTGKIYIGESKDILTRWKSYNRKACKKQKRIYNSIIKYGVENHIFEIIESCKFKDLKCKERYWQDFYDATGENGLNCELTDCDTLKKERTAESRELQSISARGNKNAMFGKTGEANSFFNKEHSDEQKRQWKEFRKGTTSCEKHALSKRIIDDSTNTIYHCRKDILTSLTLEVRILDKILNNYGIDGYFIRYLDNHNASNIRVLDTQNNTIYNSIREASEITGYNIGTLKKYLRGVINNKTTLKYLKEMEITSENSNTKIYINNNEYVINFGDRKKGESLAEDLIIKGDIYNVKVEPTCFCTGVTTEKGDAEEYIVKLIYKNVNTIGKFTKTVKLNYMLLNGSRINKTFKITGNIV